MSSVKVVITKKLFKRDAEVLAKRWGKKLKGDTFVLWNVCIRKGGWDTSFCVADKRKIWKRVREEVRL